MWLQQPLTYMNLSGKAVAPLARFFKILPDEILVVHDELDIPPGQMKLKQGGGNGGHNGLKDIQAQLGTGRTSGACAWASAIRATATRSRPTSCASRQAPNAGLSRRMSTTVLKALDLLLAGEMDKAMMKIHAKPPRPKPPAPPQLNPLLKGLMSKVPAATPSPSHPASPAGPAAAGTQEPAE